MRTSLLALALVLSSCIPNLCDLCGRHSDCAGGQICTAAGQCAIPPDAGEGPPDAPGTTTTMNHDELTGAAIPEHAGEEDL